MRPSLHPATAGMAECVSQETSGSSLPVEHEEGAGNGGRQGPSSMGLYLDDIKIYELLFLSFICLKLIYQSYFMDLDYALLVL